MGSSNRSRNVLSSSTDSFFIWWVTFRASNAPGKVHPLTVWARMTVGASVSSTAVAYAAYSFR